MFFYCITLIKYLFGDDSIMLWTQYQRLEELKKHDKDLKDEEEFRMPSSIEIYSKKELLKLQHMRPESLQNLRNEVTINLDKFTNENEAIVESIEATFEKLKSNSIKGSVRDCELDSMMFKSIVTGISKLNQTSVLKIDLSDN